MVKKGDVAGSSGMVAKKGKKISTPRDPNAPHIGDWDRSKFGQRDL
jgi:hypothetical protein